MFGFESFMFRKRTPETTAELAPRLQRMQDRQVIRNRILAGLLLNQRRTGMRSSLHYALIALLAFALVCASPATGQAQRRSVEGSFDRTLTVGNTVDLDVATGSGSIDIRQGSSGRVEIHGKVRSGTDWFRSDRDAEDIVREIEANPPIEQVGNTIRVGRE